MKCKRYFCTAWTGSAGCRELEAAGSGGRREKESMIVTLVGNKTHT